ncbi:MAG: DUF5522 domain-containing protein [Actinomycetota bacterium]|nr:DUF5522 domain-containing protein [Actinomycetota bacterium]
MEEPLSPSVSDENAAISAAHDAADAVGRDGYIDPLSGLYVFTAGHHLRRGTCCGSGCRHCPYPDTASDQ